MDRLRDAPDDVLAKDPALARAAALLRAEEPLAPSEIRQRRVVAAVRRRLRLRRLVALSSVVAAIAALLLLGAASPDLRRAARELLGLVEAPPAPPAPPSSDAPIAPAPVALAPPPPPAPPPVERVSPPVSPPEPLVRSGSPRARGERRARPVAAPEPAQNAPNAAPPPAPAPAPPVEEAAPPSLPGLDRASAEEVKLVFDAMDALRNRHDHRTATRLLDEYLARFPNGAIHEDALYLAIEAAVAAHSPRAAALGASYLERYPSGRFRRAAGRARDGGAR